MTQYPGLLVYIVGPSGAGKDSLIEAARRHFAVMNPARYPSIHFVRRFITRPAEAGHEQHIALTAEEFSRCSARGDFVMEWHRNGLAYGIGREMLPRLEQGGMVVMNGSRMYAPQAFSRIAPLLLVEVTVRPGVLRRRLELRARESREAIEARLMEAELRIPDCSHHVRIDNSGSIEAAQQAFITLLNNTPVYPAQLHQGIQHDSYS